MKSKLLLLFIALSQVIFAQTFNEISPAAEFDGVEIGSIAFSDVDGDGDNDVLITGYNSSGEIISKLYTNAGGNFTEVMGTPFDGVYLSSIAFSDVDGDGDDDVLITGLNGSGEMIAKLYTNVGGSFTEVMGTPFVGVNNGSIAFSDVDGDGDNDVLITGQNGSEPIAKLYTNAGGSFTEVIGTPFEGVYYSSIAFSDVDGDGDNDVLITGRNSSYDPIGKLYTNVGGSFTEVMGTPFDGVETSSIAFSDVDGDGDEDVLITGQNGSELIAKLYTNAGGSFTEVMGTPFEGVYYSSIAFSDVDGDGDNDMLITGSNGSDRIAKLYTNNGGSFTEVMGTPFDGVENSSIAFSDVDGDMDNDVLIIGLNGSGERIAKLYIKEGGVSLIDEFKIGNSLKFLPFPNPSISSTLSIEYKGGEMGEATIKVYNLNGILLQQQSEFIAEGHQIFPLNIKSLSRGTYLIELHVGKKIGTAKFIVQ